jgi:ribosomal-protein-alanine N-acetyltransferase
MIREGGQMIREGGEGDFKALLKLEKIIFPGGMSYSPSYLKYLLKRGDSFTFIASEKRKIVGFSICVYQNSDLHLISIGVHPDYRGRGYATKMLELIEERGRKNGASSCYLEVRVTNHEAMRLYRKFGYVIEKVLPEYYSVSDDGGRDAFLMRKCFD